MTRRQRKIVQALSIYSLVGLILLWVLIPILYIVLASLQPEINLISIPLKIGFDDFGIGGYKDAFANDRLMDGLKNSAIVAGLATLIVLVVGLSAAYPLMRRTGRIRWWAIGMLATQTVPVITLVIPVFIVLRNLNLLDQLGALSLVYAAFLLPISILILRNFLADVPESLERAALIDGCTRFQAFRRVIMPIAAPGIAAVAIFVFINSWNEFLFALVLTGSNQTITVRLAELQGSVFEGLDIPALAAATVIAVIPVLFVVIALHRTILSGIIARGGTVRG
ncbi:MAG: carbohydrate ABC transporter permease [Actinomycetia bacterium]|nr:carbohydrate ABC transporter permease [Actinomycetes bacterium]